MLWSQQVAAPSATFSGGNYMLTNYCLADDYPSYDSNCFAGEYPGGPSGIYRPNGIVENRWYRIEGWAVQSSPGAQDGTLHIDIFDQSNTARPFVAYDGTVRTRSASTPSWQYLVWQNYLGNGLEQGNIYQDDFFIQFGSRARVELCAESTWSGRKHCEIQIPSAWSANAITLTVNKASFTSGQTAYLYVVDSSGNVNSSGYLVTIGSGGGTPPPADTTPPAPPTGLKVQ
jgi:hypothetical protein